jgi:glycosyltransferase
VKVTLITATYNSAATIRDTLDCIAAQDYPDIEHLIIDGVSKDATLAIVAEYPHVARVICEPDKGLYDAMNKGVQAASGEVIGILNSDDFYPHPQVISRVVALMEKTGADALYADLDYVDAENTDAIVRSWKSQPYHQRLFQQGWMPPHPTFFVRKGVYEQYGGFNTQLRFAADYELMLRFLLRHGVSVCYLPEVVTKMRMGGLSNAAWKNRLKANREDREAWRLNGLQPRWYTIVLKPLRKIGQFLPWGKG